MFNNYSTLAYSSVNISILKDTGVIYKFIVDNKNESPCLHYLYDDPYLPTILVMHHQLLKDKIFLLSDIYTFPANAVMIIQRTIQIAFICVR